MNAHSAYLAKHSQSLGLNRRPKLRQILVRIHRWLTVNLQRRLMFRPPDTTAALRCFSLQVLFDVHLARVSHHVAAVLRKLGVETRGGAAWEAPALVRFAVCKRATLKMT